MSKETHCERVLALLSDGKPHTHHELYALHVIAHSRVSELRKRLRPQGQDIACWRVGDDSIYQLVSLDSAAGVPSAPPLTAAESSESLSEGDGRAAPGTSTAASAPVPLSSSESENGTALRPQTKTDPVAAGGRADGNAPPALALFEETG